MPLCFHLF